MKTFEQFLKEIHALDYTGTDDAMGDSFEFWLLNLDVAEVIVFAETWGKALFDLAQYAEAKKHILA